MPDTEPTNSNMVELKDYGYRICATPAKISRLLRLLTSKLGNPNDGKVMFYY
jgi:hypothetical protein